VPDAEELARSELARKVASTLHQYGISNEMLAEAQTRGAYDSVIGTYRIVLYQAQSADVDKVRYFSCITVQHYFRLISPRACIRRRFSI
jgi:hypothetical protein